MISPLFNERFATLNLHFICISIPKVYQYEKIDVIEENIMTDSVDSHFGLILHVNLATTKMIYKENCLI